MKPVVFVGPTLSPAQRAGAAMDFRPPVAQGDVYRACAEGALAIGIIDGYFENRPAVWHKEILWALSRGVAVYGAGSLGALRAAELHSFGMIGVGRVFEMIRDGDLTDDDEVALVHAPMELDFAPLSVPMVNIRATLERAVEEGVLSSASARALETVAKASHYPQRCYEMLLRAGAEARVSAQEMDALANWLPAGKVDLKARDAKILLERIAQESRESAPNVGAPQFRFEHTYFWEMALHEGRKADEPQGAKSSLEDMLDELALQGSWHVHERLGAWRGLALDEARRCGLRPTDADVEVFVDDFRRRRGLEEAASFEVYLDGCGLTRAAFWHLASDEVALLRLTRMYAKSTRNEILNELRVSGAFDPLRERAERKLAVVVEAKRENIRSWSEAELLAWWFVERADRAVPDDIESYAVSTGFATSHRFLRAVLRERLYFDHEDRMNGEHAVRLDREAEVGTLAVGDPLTAVLSAGRGHPLDLATLAGSTVVLVFAPQYADPVDVREGQPSGTDGVVVLYVVDDEALRGRFDDPGPLCVVDSGGTLARRCGITHTASAVVVLDPAQRICCIAPSSQWRSHAWPAIRRLQQEERSVAGVDHAPALIVPAVFEHDFCDRLVALFQDGEKWDTGITARTHVGTKNNIQDGEFKRRLDYVVESGQVREAILSRLTRRLLPAVDLSFSYRPHDWEPFCIGCYDERNRGFFKRHRDVTGPTSRHRRFSMVVALTDPRNYQGGSLTFPEFPGSSYRPEKGSAVVFASRLLHEVSPVDGGQRFVVLSRLLDRPLSAANDAVDSRLGS